MSVQIFRTGMLNSVRELSEVVVESMEGGKKFHGVLESEKQLMSISLSGARSLRIKWDPVCALCNLITSS